MAEHDDNLDLDIDLEAIRAREKAATIGPWLTHEMPRNGTVFVGPGRPGSLSDVVYATADHMDDLTPNAARRERSNAEFIAHARTDIPALLAALDAERAKNTEALALHHGPQLSDFNTGEFCSCGDRWPCKHRRILLGGKD